MKKPTKKSSQISTFYEVFLYYIEIRRCSLLVFVDVTAGGVQTPFSFSLASRKPDAHGLTLRLASCLTVKER